MFLFVQSHKELVDPYAVVAFAGHKVLYVHLLSYQYVDTR